MNSAKKIMSVALALAMASSLAVSASAKTVIDNADLTGLKTEVTYRSTSAGIDIDIDGDNITDLTTTDTVTFGVKVPATVVVDGTEDTKAYIAGLTDTSVTLSTPTTTEMTQNEVKTNKLTADVKMGDNNTLVMPYSVLEVEYVNANVNSKWDDAKDKDGIDTKPLTGTWSGVQNYNVDVAERDAQTPAQTPTE